MTTVKVILIILVGFALTMLLVYGAAKVTQQWSQVVSEGIGNLNTVGE